MSETVASVEAVAEALAPVATALEPAVEMAVGVTPAEHAALAASVAAIGEAVTASQPLLSFLEGIAAKHFGWGK